MSEFKIERHAELAQITTEQDVALGIMKWGSRNAFPSTLEHLIEKSPSAKQAVSRTIEFVRGDAFEGENMIVNSTGLTLGHVVDILVSDLVRIGGYTIHTNLNIKGNVKSINGVRLAEYRLNEFDELNYASKLGYFYNYGRNSNTKKTVDQTASADKIKWFDRFNPHQVANQIKKTEGGLANYNGQIYYYSNSGYSSYPIPRLQAPINYLLSDIENGILARKEVSTGFLNNYILKTTMSSEDQNLIDLETAIEESQGVRGYAKIITMPNLTPEDVGATLLEEIGQGSSSSGNIVDAIEKAALLAKRMINGAYFIPPMLAGEDQSTGFSADTLEDAYEIFNAITEPLRNAIEKGVNEVLKYAKLEYLNEDVPEEIVHSIKLVPLQLRKPAVDVAEVEEEIDPQATANLDRNPLTGKQEQVLQRVVRKYNKGDISREQAADLLRSDMKFDEDRIDTWLGTEEKQEEDV